MLKNLYSYKESTKPFKFSVNVGLPKTNLLSKFRSSTRSPYYTSHLSQYPPVTQLWKLLKYPKFRLKYPQWRSMLRNTEHTVLKVGLRTNIICKKIFGHSLNYSTGRLQTLHPPQGTLLNVFFIITRKFGNYDTATRRKCHKMVAHHTL